MSRWTRVLVSFGIVAVALGIYLWFFGTQNFFALEERNTGQKLPFVNLVSVELTNMTISQAPGTKLS